MKKCTTWMVCGALVTAALGLAAAPALSQEGTPMTPELASKREMVRKQEEQRITNAQRKAAAEALKAQRLKLLQAKEAQGLPTGEQGK